MESPADQARFAAYDCDVRKLRSFTVNTLAEACDIEGLPYHGSKTVLIDRLLRFYRCSYSQVLTTEEEDERLRLLEVDNQPDLVIPCCCAGTTLIVITYWLQNCSLNVLGGLK